MPTAERRRAAEAKAKAAEEKQALEAAEQKAEAAESEADAAQNAADAATARELVGKAKRPAPKMSEGKWYVNSSRNNIYTENGRCMPDQKIQLPPELAKKYQGLDECQD